MLIWAWMKHLEMHGQPLEKLPGETKKAFDQRSMPHWGLVEWVAYSYRRFRVDKLLIEAKATGITCAQELRHLYKEEDWAIELPNPDRDKVARAHTAEPSFAAGPDLGTGHRMGREGDRAGRDLPQVQVQGLGRLDDASGHLASQTWADRP
ncbi:hypothetical protein [Bradyrhizobium sp. USDA 10063]